MDKSISDSFTLCLFEAFYYYNMNKTFLYLDKDICRVLQKVIAF
jgi:hypothetical protein